jgi:plasmid stabilization system protein ParE
LDGLANIAFLPIAESEYFQALAWYQGRSPKAAAGFEAAMDAGLQRIADSPETWPLCDKRHRFYVLHRYPYSLIYRIENEDVLIVAVAHSSRHPAFWQGRG